MSTFLTAARYIRKVIATWASCMTICLLVITCRKDVSRDSFIAGIKNELSGSMSNSLYAAADWNSSIMNTEGGVRFMRIGFIGKEIREDFILVRLDGSHVAGGRIVSIHPIFEDGFVYGDVSVWGLDGKVVVSSTKIEKGFVEWGSGRGGLLELGGSSSLNGRGVANGGDGDSGPPDGSRFSPEMVVPGSGGKVLPEVILVSTIKKPDPTYYYALTALGGGTVSGNSASYSPSSTAGGTVASGGGDGKSLPAGKSGTSGAGGKGGSGDGGTIVVDFENAASKTAINVAAYVKCFDQIPDAGSSCSIELCSDIPVDNNPNLLFDWRTGSPGHCFLQLKKTLGTQSVVQNIGFYPETDYKSILTPAPVNGKFVDNSNHEFNASIKMTLTADNFRAAVNQLLYLSKFVKYDIDEYNCTDFALEIFNFRRATPLVITKINMPGGQAPAGSNSPQGVYLKLQEMKKANGSEAVNITTDIVKAFVGNGKGPCN